MFKMYEHFMHSKLLMLGFSGVEMRRLYMPVPLKVTFTEVLFGQNTFNHWQEYIKHGPEDMNETECYVLSARDVNDEYALFIAGPEDEIAYGYDPNMGRIKLTFEPEKFLYIMEHASRRNSLNFFRNAVLPSIVEANKFLEMVDDSFVLSQKNKNRAHTWVRQLIKGKNI
ncbi:MAG: hypothetical protein IJ870_04990 [Alphaproteobacteria bacterium]|nr:hypothetical protein [Alphaproteobacteria bacterium]